MLPVIEAAVRDRLTQHFVVDPDCAAIPEFQKIAESVKLDANGAVNENTLRDAVKQMKALKPNLFAVTDYGTLSPDEFEKQEVRLREQLRRRRETTRGNEFSALDATGLNDSEMDCLRAYLGGSRSSWNRSVLQRALNRQNNANAPTDAA